MAVSGGLFTTQIDVGGGVFYGMQRWLEIGVRPGGSTGAYTTLSPKQELTPAPYALALPGLYTEQNDTSPNVIGGYAGNWVTEGAYGAAIGGGGDATGSNRVTDNYGTVGGGYGNQAGTDDGSTGNQASATVGGGYANAATGGDSTVGGGVNNTAGAFYATVGGGALNSAGGQASCVGGGYQNSASALYATVGGGFGNAASGEESTIGGGFYNIASADYATIAGGGPSDPDDPETNNRALDAYATIGGGGSNRAGSDDGNPDTDPYATVGGGAGNTASGAGATVGGGEANVASGWRSTIGGGDSNSASIDFAAVGGGFSNIASGGYAVVAGGNVNQAGGSSSTVGGGQLNVASGPGATVPGGESNTAAGLDSYAAGRRAKANYSGCFVWGDSTNSDVACNTSNMWVARTSGGAVFWSNSGMSTGVYLQPGAGSWTSASDRALKENVESVDTQALLERLAGVPVTTWSYKSQDDSIRHIGPMAQDFYAAFGVGEDDKHISTVDADGVALAAIQGLHAENQALKAQVAALEEENANLDARLTALEQSAQGSRPQPARSSAALPWLLAGGLVVAGGAAAGLRRRPGGQA